MVGRQRTPLTHSADNTAKVRIVLECGCRKKVRIENYSDAACSISLALLPRPSDGPLQPLCKLLAHRHDCRCTEPGMDIGAALQAAFRRRCIGWRIAVRSRSSAASKYSSTNPRSTPVSCASLSTCGFQSPSPFAVFLAHSTIRLRAPMAANAAASLITVLPPHQIINALMPPMANGKGITVHSILPCACATACRSSFIRSKSVGAHGTLFTVPRGSAVQARLVGEGSDRWPRRTTKNDRSKQLSNAVR